MKSSRLYILCLFFNICFPALSAWAQRDTAFVYSLFKEVQSKYAPDKRDEYLHLQLKGDSVILESTSEKAIAAFQQGLSARYISKFKALKLPEEGLGNMIYGVSNISVANNRSMPQHGAELITQMLLGTPVQVLKRQGGFYLIRTPDNYLGWTDAPAVKLMNREAYQHWQQQEKVVYITDYGHVFRDADKSSQRVSDIVSGNVLEVSGQRGRYIRVSFPDGRSGYVAREDTMPYREWIARKNPSAAAVLAKAVLFVGVPYLWGGTSVKGVDCSGFTKMAYFLNGIIIPRDASQQALVGEEVDVMEKDSISVSKCLQNLLPGDLLFFSAAKRRGINGGRITHTAIYMGNGEFIQAAGMVKISSFIEKAPNYDGGQTVTLVGARRILTAIGQSRITRVDQHPWYN